MEISRAWLIYSTLELESENVNVNLIYSYHLQLFYNLIRKETWFLCCNFQIMISKLSIFVLPLFRDAKKANKELQGHIPPHKTALYTHKIATLCNNNLKN